MLFAAIVHRKADTKLACFLVILLNTFVYGFIVLLQVRINHCYLSLRRVGQFCASVTEGA